MSSATVEKADADLLWSTVCTVDDLVKNSGVCALLNGQQIAIFYIPSTENKVFAVSNYDPIGKANVLYRGITGDLQGHTVVASPLYKQHFSLLDGHCLEQEEVITTYPVRIEGNAVQVAA